MHTEKINYLSQLLADIPSDTELEQLYAGKSKRNPSRRCLSRKDLFILQLRAEGMTYQKIGAELGVSGSRIRASLLPIKMRLVGDLGIVIDVPGLLP